MDLVGNVQGNDLATAVTFVEYCGTRKGLRDCRRYVRHCGDIVCRCEHLSAAHIPQRWVVSAAKMLKEHGALRVFSFITHGVLSGAALALHKPKPQSLNSDMLRVGLRG